MNRARANVCQRSFAFLRKLRLEPLEDRRLLTLNAELVADVFPGLAPAGSDPTQFLEMGAFAAFWADDGIHGAELWRTDGTEAGTYLVKDIHGGTSGSNPLYSVGPMTRVGNILYFTADDGVHGKELWRSDGTEAGTHLLRDLTAGSAGTFDSFFSVFAETVGGKAYFSTGPTSGGRLIATDGSSDGTAIIKSFAGGWADQAAGVGDDLFFTNAGSELWKTDGTALGTVRVSTVRAKDLTALHDKLLFIGSTSGVNEELWESDGTAEGTVVVKDASAGNSYASDLTLVNDRVYYRRLQGLSPRLQHQLWTSDGSESGTSLVTTVSGQLGDIAASGDRAYFVVDREGVDGTEQLWSVAAGAAPQLARSFSTQDFNYNVNVIPLQDVSGTLYFGFSLSTSFRDFLLWKSDGTQAGTVQVGDVSVDWSSQATTVVLNGKLVFKAGNVSEWELWKSEGTAAATSLIKDIRPGTPQSSAVSNLVAIGDTLFFSAFDGVTGRELWKSDGASSGTSLVKNLRPDYDDGETRYLYSYAMYELTNVGGKLFFATAEEFNDPVALWKSDGTESGTVQLLQLSGDHYASAVRPHNLVHINGVLYFAADSWGGAEPWRSDGSAAGTQMVRDIVPGVYQDPFDLDTAFNYGSSPAGFVGLDGIVLFAAESTPAGWTSTDRELWRTDGSDAGTVRVKDILPGVGGSYPNSLTRFGDRVLFFARSEDSTFDLWETDGTADGTALVSDLPPNELWDFHPQGLFSAGGKLFFANSDADAGMEIWVTDGTAGGTKRLRDIATGARDGDPTLFLPWGDSVVFSADDGVSGRELWISDGTERGTRLLVDVRDGSGGSNPSNLTVEGDRLFFTADDAVHGEELWVTDGTTSGTYLVSDLRDGIASSSPTELTTMGNTLYFSADDGIYGRELWKVVVDESDTSPPQLTGVYSAGVPLVAGQELHHQVDNLTLALSEAVGDSVTDSASWGLSHNGGDAASQIASINFGFNAANGSYEAAIGFQPALANGEFTLTLKDTVTDLAGNALDGDGDGQPGGDYSITFVVRSPVPSGDEFRVNTFTTGDQRGFPTSPGQIAMAADGSFVITWVSVGQEGTGDEIYFQRFDPAGNPAGQETRANSIATGNQRNSTIAAIANGGFVIAWNDDHVAANGFDIYARRFDADGAPLSDEFLVNAVGVAGAQRSPTVTSAPDGRFAVVWHGPDAASNGIYARLYAQDGAPLSDEIGVNQFTTGQQQIKSAAMSSTGTLLVVWQSDGQDGDAGGIYARVFDADASPLTGEFPVTQSATGNQQNPTVAADSVGNFLTSWTSEGQGDASANIYARRFNALGQPLGDEFLVNETTTGSQRYSTVAMDADGDAIITWSSLDQDGSGYGIYARRYNATGQPEGHEFRLNSFTAGNQVYSSPALDAEGDFVVVWSSQGQDGSGYGVYGQRYAMPRTRQPGDADGDGDVDLNDLNAVRNHFGELGTGVLGDTNDDGRVDLNDLNAVRNNFGAVSGVSEVLLGDDIHMPRRRLPTAFVAGSLAHTIAASHGDILFTALGATENAFLGVSRGRPKRRDLR